MGDDRLNVEWDTISNDAVRLSEFEHSVIYRIKSLKNMGICPRIRAENEYHIYVLRIELMFGAEVFDECSRDILIPLNKMSNDIQMPKEVFGENDFYYSSLPREC